MSEPLLLPTDDKDVVLCELWSDADDKAYNAAYNASRAEISVYDPDAATKHQTIEDTRQARINAGSKIRMGIWAGGIFVGSINATPGEDGLEIGYWVDSRHTGHGFATLATKAFSEYMNETRPYLHAKVMARNLASMHVLEKSGYGPALYSPPEQSVDELSFELTNPIRPLFNRMHNTALAVPRGEYRLIEGSDDPTYNRKGELFIATGNQQFTSGPFPGVHTRGVYRESEDKTIVSFLYNKLSSQGELETSERMILWEGVGYGEHPGHKGQPPTWYLVGPEIGKIDHKTGELLTTVESGITIPAKHFSMASIVGGPLKRLILANPGR
jgi:RimJ/RimL family protein N-acetyltransferase